MLSVWQLSWPSSAYLSALSRYIDQRVSHVSCAGDTTCGLATVVAVALATDEEEEDDEEEDEDDDDDDVAFVFVFFAPAGAARCAALRFDDILTGTK